MWNINERTIEDDGISACEGLRIVLIDKENMFFSRNQESQFSADQKSAFVFNCLNSIHADIILEKTKSQTENASLEWKKV